VHTDEIRKLGALEDRHWWYAERRSIIERAIRGIEPRGVALDVGAAAGGNTRVLRGAGWRCIALEMGETGVELARARGLSVLRGDAIRLPVRDGSLGLVVAFDVLEHIDDHEAAAAELFRGLMPGGRLLVAVPADMRLWSAHDVAVDHVRRYEREELRALIESAGFVEVSVKSWNVLLRPVVVLRRKRASGSDLEEPGRIANAALRTVVRFERVLPVDKVSGVSLMLSARKPG
jgi:SAM-dependent methyltransferase